MDASATLAFLLTHVIDGAEARPAPEVILAVLDAAERFAQRYLAPLAPIADRHGCQLSSGRVTTAPGHVAAWHAFAEAGWAGLAAGESSGGQGLPLAVAAAAQELFDAADCAFGLLAINAPCATRLLERHGDPAVRELWLPRLASGEWGATICISEPQAGSDVGRIRTLATQDASGNWRLDGGKCWISYGDHDLTARIGHFVLARMQDAPAGTKGLSLFLAPDSQDDGTRNGVTVTRIERKLGLHGSPTCMLAFENSTSHLIGSQGRGLSTLFAMIVAMRLGVAAQGAALAQAAASVAESYAEQRVQGGDQAAPVTITAHADVRRLLLGMRARAEAARLIMLQTAAWIDAGDMGDAAAASRAAMMLPVAKTFGAEAAFANADCAIQVLGGAGYVDDWPVERMLRDCRVFSIYEGTTAIQGLDLLQRRILGEDGQTVLSDIIRRLSPDPAITSALLNTTAALAGASVRQREIASVPFLKLIGLACADGLLRRAGREGGVLSEKYSALAAFFGAQAIALATLLVPQCDDQALDPLFNTVYLGNTDEPTAR